MECCLHLLLIVGAKTGEFSLQVESNLSEKYEISSNYWIFVVDSASIQSHQIARACCWLWVFKVWEELQMESPPMGIDWQ